MQRNNANGNSLPKDLEDELSSSSAIGPKAGAFTRIIIVILCTVFVLGLFIFGTALSYPQKTATFTVDEGEKPIDLQTTQDRNYKIIGRILIFSGVFLLVIDFVLCAIVSKDASIASRSIKP